MDDLINRLEAMTPPHEAASADPDADVARGRSALRTRRLRWGAGGATACVAAAAVSALLLSGNGSAPTHQANTGHGGQGVQIQLVDYTGPQEAGFTVSSVPQGYVLQGAQPSSLDIAPADDHTSLDVWQGKLVVMLQSIDVKTDTNGTPVTVNGKQGYLRHSAGATILEYTDGTHDIVVQSWDNIELTDDQLVQFAEGVTVTSAAQAGRG